eukprot:5590032-Prymnesium_polylepis.1
MGPVDSSLAAVEALRNQERMRPVTIAGLRSKGFETMAWVHPDEKPSGINLSDTHDYTHGAFLYEVPLPCRL